MNLNPRRPVTLRRAWAVQHRLYWRLLTRWVFTVCRLTLKQHCNQFRRRWIRQYFWTGYVVFSHCFQSMFVAVTTTLPAALTFLIIIFVGFVHFERYFDTHHHEQSCTISCFDRFIWSYRYLVGFRFFSDNWTWLVLHRLLNFVASFAVHTNDAMGWYCSKTETDNTFIAFSETGRIFNVGCSHRLAIFIVFNFSKFTVASHL